jgi:hypothetical protein
MRPQSLSFGICLTQKPVVSALGRRITSASKTLTLLLCWLCRLFECHMSFIGESQSIKLAGNLVSNGMLIGPETIGLLSETRCNFPDAGGFPRGQLRYDFQKCRIRPVTNLIRSSYAPVVTGIGDRLQWRSPRNWRGRARSLKFPGVAEITGPGLPLDLIDVHLRSQSKFFCHISVLTRNQGNPARCGF